MTTRSTGNHLRALVAAGHEEVTAAAGAVLRSGGNAFDAAIAAGFASAVVEPGLTSLGGGGFMLARTPQDGARLFDFFVDTPGRGLPAAEPALVPVTVRFPGSEQEFYAGPGSAAVPGALAGYLHVHRVLGRLPLADVVAPAARLARDGVVVNRWHAYILGLLEPIMTMHADGRRLFAPRGRYVRAGDRLGNPDLAAFLLELPRAGTAALYVGDRAAAIAADMSAAGGLLGTEDLAAYRVVEREPLRFEYRGSELLTNPPPSFGGSLLALSLHLLAGAVADERGSTPADLAATLAAVMIEVDRLRSSGVYGPLDLDADAQRRSVERVRTASGGTTHVSVCDAEGNVASMTTSNGEGSGYFVPDTGIMLNNMMGEDDLHPDGFHAAPPGRRVASMMSPSMLIDGDGGARLVVGSGGSKRIRTALLQVIHRVLDLGEALTSAVEGPRIHWDGSVLQMEPGFDVAAMRAVETRWPVNRWSVLDVYFGGVHAISPTHGEAAADPRRGGSAASF